MLWEGCNIPEDVFARIGSDEDDDGSDESLSAEDPSETAVSRDAKLEQTAGLETLDADGQPNQAEEAGTEGNITVLEVAPVQERGENLEAAGASPARVNGTAPVLVNGDVSWSLMIYECVLHPSVPVRLNQCTKMLNIWVTYFQQYILWWLACSR